MKRAFDIIVSTFLLVALCGLLVFLAVLIKINLGSPIIYRQIRPGKNGVPFLMYKFRSMTDSVDSQGIPLSDNLRITRFGRLIRSTSLDELPELWNVLIGDMSIVGPRPLLMEYLKLYTKEQMGRHSVKPGITGWAQVNGRNSLSWNKKFDLDLWYVKNHSLMLDLKIIIKTIGIVLKRESIDSSQDLTMPKFTGENQE